MGLVGFFLSWGSRRKGGGGEEFVQGAGRFEDTGSRLSYGRSM